MKDSRPITLSENELLAISVRSNFVWPTPILSVNRLDPNELREAVEKGAISLVEAGLLEASQDRLEKQTGALILPVQRGRVIMGSYLAKRSDPLFPLGMARYIHGGEGGWCSELIAATGDRRLEATSRVDGLRLLEDDLDVAVAQRLGDSGKQALDIIFCAWHARATGEPRMVYVSTDGLGRIEIGQRDHWAYVADSPFPDAKSAVRFLAAPS